MDPLLPRQPRGDATPQHDNSDLSYFKGSMMNSQSSIYDYDSRSSKSIEAKHWNARRIGPLDYSSSRTVKYVEGSTSGSSGPNPLPRFAVSRFGPLAYK